MIVTPASDGELRLVTQTDHAHLAGEILSLWRADALPAHPRRAEIVFAARRHDNGWREEDAAPRVDRETGRPADFTTLPRAARIELWLRGTERFAAERPYAALLVTEHARALHHDRRGDVRWEEELLAPLDERRRELLEVTGADPVEVAADYRFIALADRLSLIACAGWTDLYAAHGYRAAWRPPTLVVEPFPLAGATTFRVRARTIPDRAYPGDAVLGATLAAARFEELAVRLAPPAAATAMIG